MTCTAIPAWCSGPGALIPPWAPNGTDLQTLGRKFAFFNSYKPAPSWDLYITDGSTEDYAYGRLGRAGYCFELGDAFFESCSTFEFDILPATCPRSSTLPKLRTPYMTPAGPDSSTWRSARFRSPAGTTVTLTGQVNDTRYQNNPDYPPNEPTHLLLKRSICGRPVLGSGLCPHRACPRGRQFHSSSENVTVSIDPPIGLMAGILCTCVGRITKITGAQSARSSSPSTPPPAQTRRTLLPHKPVLNPNAHRIGRGQRPLSFEIVSNPIHGMLSGIAPALIYTPVNWIYWHGQFHL